MKILLIVALTALMLAQASAEEIQITATGTIYNVSGGDSNVQVGDLMTDVVTINSDAPSYFSVEDLTGYLDTASTGKCTVGDLTFYGTGTRASVYSDYPDNGVNLNGYFLGTKINNETTGSFSITAEGPDSSDWPSTALSGLAQDIPLSDYTELNMSIATTDNLFEAGADITSLTAVVVPEPSSWALLLGGLGAIAFIRARARRA